MSSPYPLLRNAGGITRQFSRFSVDDRILATSRGRRAAMLEAFVRWSAPRRNGAGHRIFDQIGLPTELLTTPQLGVTPRPRGAC